MSQSSPPSKPVVPGDMLPPVEPPSAGFILQLFVVPGIIVAIIVMVWLLFNWVARTGNDPREYVLALKRNNANSWQAAVNLANALGNPGAAGPRCVKTRPWREIWLRCSTRKPATAASRLELRIYLCKALGEFETPEGLAGASQSSRHPAERRGVGSAAGGAASHCGFGRKHQPSSPGPVAGLAGGGGGADRGVARRRCENSGDRGLCDGSGGRRKADRSAGGDALRQQPRRPLQCRDTAGGAGRCPGSAGVGGNARPRGDGRRRLGKERGVTALQAGADRHQRAARGRAIAAPRFRMPIWSRCGTSSSGSWLPIPTPCKRSKQPNY